MLPDGIFVNELSIMARTRNALLREGIKTAGEALAFGWGNISKIRGIGEKGLKLLMASLLEGNQRRPPEKSDFEEAFKRLTTFPGSSRYKKAMELRYGFGGGRRHTLKEVGGFWG